MRKRRHHYVPKFYLRPWATGQRIFCFRDGQIKPVGLRDVGVEEDFYEVRDLTSADVEVLWHGVIQVSPVPLRLTHEALLHKFKVVAFANQLRKDRPEMEAEMPLSIPIKNCSSHRVNSRM